MWNTCKGEKKNNKLTEYTKNKTAKVSKWSNQLKKNFTIWIKKYTKTTTQLPNKHQFSDSQNSLIHDNAYLFPLKSFNKAAQSF